MRKKTKQFLEKASKIAMLSVIIAGIIRINVLKLQDETLSNYEKITDTGTSDYHNTQILPLNTALFYEEETSSSGFKIREQMYAKKKLKLLIMPENTDKYTLYLTEKLYDAVPNRSEITDILLVYETIIDFTVLNKIFKKNFPQAKISYLFIGDESEYKKDIAEEYLNSDNDIVIFMANLDQRTNKNLINKAVTLAKQYNYQVKALNIADEYASSLSQNYTNYDYLYDDVDTINSLTQQKENLERFITHYYNEIIHYFEINLQKSQQSDKTEVPEKNIENYRLFDRGTVYIKITDKENSRLFEELKLNQDEGIIAVIANMAKRIAVSGKNDLGKYFHIYLLTEMEQIPTQNNDFLLNSLEPDDGVYVSYNTQAGLLTADERPDNGNELLKKLRSVAQIKDTVKNEDLALYRFKYTEIQYEN